LHLRSHLPLCHAAGITCRTHVPSHLAESVLQTPPSVARGFIHNQNISCLSTTASLSQSTDSLPTRSIHDTTDKMSRFANFQQKMNSLRIEADENASKAEELKSKVKALEQENLQKEQEITSLSHRNQLLESEVDKLETGIKEAKAAASDSTQHSTQNEALQRRLQLLEEEAENADKTLRETNEKYDMTSYPNCHC